MLAESSGRSTAPSSVLASMSACRGIAACHLAATALCAAAT